MQQGTADRGNRRMLLFFVAASLALIVFGPILQPVTSLLSPIFVPVDAAVSATTGLVDSLGGSLTAGSRLREENATLRRQNALLDRRLALYPLLLREDAALSRVLAFRRLNPRLELQPARVIGQSIPGLGGFITIDAGSAEGVKQANPVLDTNGFVVGKVVRLDPESSTVGLLTTPQIAIPAMDAKTGASGLVETPYGESPRLDSVLVGRRLRAGDLVVTSGLGNEFPIGSLIGQISRVVSSNVQPFQYAVIHTAANLNNLQYVQVLRNFGPGVHAVYGQSKRFRRPP